MYCARGPFTISIYASPGLQRQYRGGIVTTSRYGCYGRTNHRVLVIGIISYQGTWAWVVQNSWGAWWGATEKGAPNNGYNGGFFLLKFNENTCMMRKLATFLGGVFSVGGRHPWHLTKPMLQWDKYWGPYAGVHFTRHGGALHTARVRSLDQCAADAEAKGDSLLIYSVSGQCLTTSGSAGFSTGTGPLATVYQKGNKLARGTMGGGSGSSCGYCPRSSYSKKCGGYYCQPAYPYHYGHRCYSRCPARQEQALPALEAVAVGVNDSALVSFDAWIVTTSTPSWMAVAAAVAGGGIVGSAIAWKIWKRAGQSQYERALLG